MQGITHCGAGHTPRNLLGGSIESRAFKGGVYNDQVANGVYRPWSAADITPGPHSLKKWNADDIARYLLEGKNAHTVVHGPMVGVYAFTQNMTKADALAIGTYLTDIAPSPSRIDLSLLRSGIDEGVLVYTVHCGTCHLPSGKGYKILGVSLRNNAIVQAKDPATLINVILYGPDLPPPPFVSGAVICEIGMRPMPG